MDEKLIDARDRLIQALGSQSAFWGLGRTAGEMFAALYSSAYPLSLEELARRLQVTKGNISIAIRQLEQMGMVRRSRKKGDRRVYFEAETDFFKITHSVLSLRHKPEFDHSFSLIEESANLAAQADSCNDKEAFLRRIETLREFYRLLDGVVEITLSMPPERLRAMLDAILMFGQVAKLPSETNQ